jgi:KUP system potassium uptake protein
MNYLKTTKSDIARLSADDTQTIKWYVDSSFAVHKDMRSHTGASMTLGNGTIISDSTKQKVNARSSTECEMIAVDDTLSKILWSKRFIEAQGFKVNFTIVYQDNTSAIKLEMNGKASSGKRTRHFDIKFFYFTDLMKRGEIQVEYCPTDEMIADYFTKPLVGSKYNEFRNKIMNFG